MTLYFLFASAYEVTIYVAGSGGRDYVFSELVNPIYNKQNNQMAASVAVKYLDQRTKATQVSQFELVLEEIEGN